MRTDKKHSESTTQSTIQIPAIFPLTLAFLAGNLAVHSLPGLPGEPAYLCFLLIALLAARNIFARTLGAFAAGFCITLIVAGNHFADILPAHLEKQSLSFTAQVISIPDHYGDVLSFTATPEQDSSAIKLPNKIALKIYQNEKRGVVLQHDTIKLNDRIEVQAKLSRPRGYANPGVFEYEKWLFAQRIGARGYVSDFKVLARSSAWWKLGNLRQILITKLRDYASQAEHISSIMALGLGFSSAISKEQGDMLVATGVRHLFAISGLHINLLFVFFFFLLRVLYTHTLLAKIAYPARSLALLLALPVAGIYAALAGFSLPTQRALISLATVVIAWHSQRKLSAGQVLCIVALAVLTYDPLASLSISFWLSYGATSLIVFYLYSEARISNWKSLLQFQIYLSLGMACISMLLFSRGSLTALLANLVAVPYVSFVLLPASLLSVLALLLENLIGKAISIVAVQGAGYLFAPFWVVISWLNRHGMEWYWQPPWWIFLMLISALLLSRVLPHYRHKVLALALCLPFFYNQDSHFLEHGGFKVDFLDVGQGAAILVRTQHKILLYDTGPSFRSGFNTGDAVIIPYMRSNASKSIDIMIISHLDNDHAGSVTAVLNKIRTERILSGEPLLGSLPSLDGPCHAGQRWIWDGVLFEMLHPQAQPSQERPWHGNNASCVLRISNDRHSVLLTGDIEVSVERLLLSQLNSASVNLASDVLLVPHHGSKTSSSEEFIEEVKPKLAVVMAGYKNRYGFPNPEVLERYHERDIVVLNTAESGMISLNALPTEPLEVSQWRQTRRRYWLD